MLLLFLRPFAPRALPRFLATMNALTCAGGAFGQCEASGPVRSRQGSLLHARNLPAIPSSPTSRVRPGFSSVHLQHWRLSLAAGNSIPLGASLTHSQARSARAAASVRYPTDWPFTIRCSPRGNLSHAVPSVTREVNFSRRRTFTALVAPTRRRTGAAVHGRSKRTLALLIS